MNPKNYTSINYLIAKYKTGENIKKHEISRPKEFEPASKKTDTFELQEVVEHQEVSPDLKGHLEVREENIKLSQKLRDLGVSSTSDSKFSSYQKVTLPISDEKIVMGLHQPIYSSLRWLSMFAIYVLKQAHLTLKVIRGKATRVIYK